MGIPIVRAALTAAIVVAAVGGRQTQPAPAEPIAGGELIRMQLPLESIQPTPDQLQQWQAEPHWSFGPFDEARFGFRSVTLTLERIPLPCDIRDPAQRALVHLVVAAEGARGAAYWGLSESFPPAAPDPCDRDTTSSWSAIDSVGTPAGVAAAPDPALPIFRVAYEATWPGRTTAATAHQLIIDMRRPRPVLAARVSSSTLDGVCEFSEERPDASCTWDAQRQDFLCAETFRDARRYAWMIAGERLPRLPGSPPPPDLAEFVATLASSPHPIGTWAEPADVGAVRLIAELPSKVRGRRIFLFGANSLLGAPFVIAVREKQRTRVVPVRVNSASGLYIFAHDASDAVVVPLEEYRQTGEPPQFAVRGLTQVHRGAQLLSVVTNPTDSGVRELSHLAIEETADTVVAHAIRVASSSARAEASFTDLNANGGFDACNNTVWGFAAPVKIGLGPLRIDYRVEPSFENGSNGLQRSADTCIVASHAVWQAGKGFALTYDSAACSADSYRAVHIRPDGSLEIRTRRPEPREP